MKTSIIIPTFNESLLLADTLARVQQHDPYEVIVGDGGSADDTVAIARQMGARVVASACGRAVQMNAAARSATGDLLVFLHADSHIDSSGYKKMVDTMSRENYVGGAFSLHIQSDLSSMKTISRLATWRSRHLHLAYGDQAIFVRAEAFQALNGFSPLPICEDLDFFLKLKKHGRVIILKEKAVTSARRWLKEGVAFTTARNILITTLFLLGFPPARLSKWYLPKR
ncbi:MAG: glycosyltransferase [Nitrospina sp.]|nr:MAG: glycosyltransferase [Nitrospina sp.]TDJ58575.1 MAG: glycosyltransferase [Nitrospina sp.]